MTRIVARLAALTVLALPVSAAAQDGNRVAFTFGAGISAVPGYFGSDEFEIGPDLHFDHLYVDLGGISFGNPDPDLAPTGFGLRGSFRYVPERDSGEYPELAGLADIGTTVELGGGVGYSRPWWEVFAVARYGFGGSDAVVGDLGMDLIARPLDRLELRAGPRIQVGSDDYASTYFGISDVDSPSTDFVPFDAGGGVLSSGISVGATYRFTDAWGLAASARYERLQNDAAASPITAKDDQVSASIAITRRFDFSF